MRSVTGTARSDYTENPSPETLKADLPKRIAEACTDRLFSELCFLRTPACHSNGKILTQARVFVNTGKNYFINFFSVKMRIYTVILPLTRRAVQVRERRGQRPDLVDKSVLYGLSAGNYASHIVCKLVGACRKALIDLALDV